MKAGLDSEGVGRAPDPVAGGAAPVGVAAAVGPIPSIPCSAEGPVFAEPWQATVFALTVALHERGLFTWPQWAERLTAAIREAGLEGDPDLGDTYYVHWLRALERLLQELGIAEPLALASLQQAWRVAAERTPHGQPIALPRFARRWPGGHDESGPAPPA